MFCRLSPLQLRLYEFFLASKPVQQLLASTAPGASSGREGGSGARSGRGGRGAGASGGGGGSGVSSEPKAPRQAREDALAPLAAITALKKLCCHPDLVYDMAALAAGVARRHAGAPPAGAAPQLHRASARQVVKTEKAQQLEGEQGGAASGRGGGGGASGHGGGGGASGRGGGGAPLTGFEGCLPVFDQAEVYPKYRAGTCQSWHSGAHVW